MQVCMCVVEFLKICRFLLGRNVPIFGADLWQALEISESEDTERATVMRVSPCAVELGKTPMYLMFSFSPQKMHTSCAGVKTHTSFASVRACAGALDGSGKKAKLDVENAGRADHDAHWPKHCSLRASNDCSSWQSFRSR